MTTLKHAQRRPRTPRTTLKYLLFSLIPVVVILVVATVVLQRLEDRGTIRTTRPDDSVAYLSGEILQRFDENGVPYFRVHDISMIASVFPREKPAGTMRIVLAGGSFAQGTPYVHQSQPEPGVGDISNWLKAILRERFPAGAFEVINAGAGGQNSSRVRQFVRKFAPAHPDLVIVATGNNEGYVRPTALNEPLHQWIVYRALTKTLLPARKAEDRPYFAPQDLDTRRIERQYQDNILGMIVDAKIDGYRLALATLPINYRYVGGDPDARADVTWDEPLQKSAAAIDAGDFRAGIGWAAKSANPALAARFVAEALEREGDFRRAREFYEAYVQQLPLNRARPSFNAFVRRIAAEKGVPLVDLADAAERVSPHGIPTRDLFVDYCHLNWRGYFLMAATIADRLIELGLIPAEFGPPAPMPAIDDLVEKYRWQALRATDQAISGNITWDKLH